jgi:hypothetical protein
MRPPFKFQRERNCYRPACHGLRVIFAVALMASPVSAATITVTDTLGASYSASGLNLGSGRVANAAIYRIDVFASVTGNPTATEVFGAVSFDVVLSGIGRSSLNVTPGTGLLVPKPNYTMNNPAMFNVGDSAGNPIPLTFFGGLDLGDSRSDLLAITSAIDPSNLSNTFALDTGLPIADPRLSLGKATPFLLGTFYVTPPPFIESVGIISITNGFFSIADSATNDFSAPQSFVVPPLVIGLPEPCTLYQCVFGAIALLVRCTTAKR